MLPKSMIILIIGFVGLSCKSQNQNKILLNSAIKRSDSLIIKSTSEKFYSNNIDLDRKETQIGSSSFSEHANGFIEEKFTVNDLDNMEKNPSNIYLVYDIKDNDGHVLGSYKHNFIVKDGKIQSSDAEDLNEIRDFFSLYVKTVQDGYISYDKAMEIAAKHGFEDFSSYRLHEDGNWNFGQESEKEKPIWTFKKHHTDTNNLRCYKVLKLNANTGKIESEFIEYLID